MRRFKSKVSMLVFSISLFLSSSSGADEIYTIDTSTQDLVRIDTVLGTEIGRVPIKFGPFDGQPGTNFTSVDLTFANGNLFALSGQGYLSEITRLGNVVNFARVTDSGGNTLPNAVEGLAFDGTNLVIGYNLGGITSESNTLNVVSTSGSFGQISTNYGNHTGNPAIDTDGLAACMSNLVAVDNNDVGNGLIAGIYDMGSFTSPVWNASGNVGNNVVYDVVFLSDGQLAVMGHIGDIPLTRELQIFSNLSSTTPVNSFLFPTGNRFDGLANPISSNSCQNTLRQPSDFLCYDLLRHEKETYPKKISLLDQFGKSRDVVGHAVSICNPVGINNVGFDPKTKPDHLVCYEISEDSSDRAERQNVEIENMLETNTLITGHKDRVCLNSTKEHID